MGQLLSNKFILIYWIIAAGLFLMLFGLMEIQLWRKNLITVVYILLWPTVILLIILLVFDELAAYLMNRERGLLYNYLAKKLKMNG